MILVLVTRQGEKPMRTTFWNPYDTFLLPRDPATVVGLSRCEGHLGKKVSMKPPLGG